MNVVIYARYSSDRQTEQSKCETFGKRLALTGCPLDGSVHSVVIHIVSFLPVVPIGQPVMQLQLGVVVFQLDLDDDFFAAHGNIGDFGFQNSRHRLRWDFV